MATKMEGYNEVSSANEEESTEESTYIPSWSTSCTRCGENGHTKMQCRHIKNTCLICKKVGHLKSACKSKKKKDNKPSKQKEENVQHASRSEATFRYTVKNVSKMKASQVSPPFYVRNLPWTIKIMPRISREPGRKLKFFNFSIQCNGDSVTASWSCIAAISLRLLSNKEGQEPFSRNFLHKFCSKENNWGFSTFMYWQDVLDVNKGYIKDDTITLEAHVVANEPRGVGL